MKNEKRKKDREVEIYPKVERNTIIWKEEKHEIKMKLGKKRVKKKLRKTTGMHV